MELGFLAIEEGDEFGNTLEVFTEALCKAIGCQKPRFKDLLRSVAEDADGSFGVQVLSKQWVHLVEGLTDAQRDATARCWVKEWDPGAAQPDANSAARMLVDSICQVCARAGVEGKDLVCYWSL